MMIALGKQHAVIGMTCEERDSINSLGLILTAVDLPPDLQFQECIVLTLGIECFANEATTATFDIYGFTIVLLIRSTAEELRKIVEQDIDENTIVRVRNKEGGDLPFQLN